MVEPEASIQDDEEVDTERRLSDNVLVIEISGPDVHNLSVVDFPGLMHSMLYMYLGIIPKSSRLVLTKRTDSAVYSVLEVKAIRGLVMDYIQEPSSIVLCVASNHT